MEQKLYILCGIIQLVEAEGESPSVFSAEVTGSSPVTAPMYGLISSTVRMPVCGTGDVSSILTLTP